jgi:hypothetical protein
MYNSINTNSSALFHHGLILQGGPDLYLQFNFASPIFKIASRPPLTGFPDSRGCDGKVVLKLPFKICRDWSRKNPKTSGRISMKFGIIEFY